MFMDLSISAADKVVDVAGETSVTFLAAAGVAAGAVGVVCMGVTKEGPDIVGDSFFSSSSNLTKSSPLSTSIKLELLIGGCVVLGTAVSGFTCTTAFSFSAPLNGVAVAGVAVSMATADVLDALSVPALTAGGGDACSFSSLPSDSPSSSSSILSATPLAALAKRTFCNSDLSFGPSMADEKLFRCVLVVAFDVLAK